MNSKLMNSDSEQIERSVFAQVLLTLCFGSVTARKRALAHMFRGRGQIDRSHRISQDAGMYPMRKKLGTSPNTVGSSVVLTIYNS